MATRRKHDGIRQQSVALDAHGRGSWEVRLYRGVVDGKKRYASVTVKGTRRDAERERRRRLTAIETGGYVDPSRLTVGAYLTRWLTDAAKPRVSPKTFERYAEIVTRHLVPALGAKPLGKLSPLDVQGFYARALETGRLVRTGQPSRGLSAQTVLHHHRVLSEALRQAVKWQLLARNVCEAVEPPRSVWHERPALTETQATALLAAASTHALAVPVMLALTTGARRGEILALTWPDVDLEAGRLTIRQSLEETRTGLRLKLPKTARSRRTVTLPAQAITLLRKHRAAQAWTRRLLGAAYQDQGLVCAQPDGGFIRPKVLTSAFPHLAQTVPGLPVGLRFHDLRHSHATMLLKAGVGIRVVADRLGHATPTLTLNTYGHVLAGQDAAAAASLETALAGAMR